VFRNLVDSAFLSKREDRDPHADINIAVALYFVTYFNLSHYNMYQAKYSDLSRNEIFIQHYEKLKREKDTKNNSLKLKYQIDFKNYKKDCIEAEKGNLNKLYKVIYAKKLYSIPWLIAGNILIEKYP